MLKMPDFVLQTIIKEALAEIASDSSIIDQLFSDFTEDYFSSVFGEREIKSIKEYLEKDKIRVVVGWRLEDGEFPCYSINLVGNQEIDAESTLDDFGSEEYLDSDGEEVNKLPSGLVYPEVIPSHDSKVDRYSVPIRETLTIGCHAADNPNVGRYMAWLLQYILRSKKNTLITRGLHRISVAMSDFNRMNEYLPENIFSRFATLSCVHYLTFSESDLLLTDVEVVVKGQVDETALSPGTTDKELPSDATFVTIE